MIFTAGNRGENVRSDCFVSLTILQNKENSIELQSKVKSLYGESIIALCKDMLAFFGVEHVRLEIEDNGALPFTLAARIEAVINKMKKTHTEYLLPVLPQNTYSTPHDADRVSRLYLPGNNPKLMINAGIYGCHGVILDLEDSVAPDRKFEARYLVRNALRTVDFYGAERMVRINQLPAGLDDLYFVIPHPVNLILIPKCENADQVVQTDAKISEILGRKHDSIHLMPIIENAAGVMNAYPIARASENIAAMAIGLEDYTADIGTQRSTEGRESFFARSMVVNAARAAGIQPIDSVFSDIDDMEALARYVRESKALGFSGIGCIHPRQVPVVNENFLPDEAETEKAKRIVLAYEKAEKEGSGVATLDSKMIDPPVVKRALRTIERAIHAGKLHENWRDEHA
ncbi:MAG: citrate lyase subunit beta / citryl-CoA lyase [Bacteroidetes bacterium]|nr:citrate lyase subunit beta / citryl-CoA lyase [Bacteroidota bacterium]